ncbi:glycolate oxidase [Seiridium cupressi]
MVYNWDLHEPKCYRLYIDEKKSLEEIMDIMRSEDNFTPSKRAYQTQFRRWNFPSKQNPAHKDDRLVARVKELWERNMSQKEMLRVLTEEDGFHIKHRELMRVRTRNRWLLRTPNPDRLSTSEATPDVTSDFEYRDSDELQIDRVPRPQPAQSRQIESPPDRPSAEVTVKRRDWQQEPEMQPVEQWDHRKRRRCTRVAPGQLAGTPGQPRFPSETTIDESRVILELDTKLYQEVRAYFARICDEEGLSKKTAAGPDKWEGAKGRLIQEIPHLQSVVWVNKENVERKKLALDVICTDITKRMRSLEHKLTISDAKNILGINPEEYRIIRQDFANVLKRDHATSKTEAGLEHWGEMKEMWQASSAVLQRILTTGETDPIHTEKLRAADIVARDVMKRLRDGQSKQQQPHKKQTLLAPKPSVLRSDAESRLKGDDLDIQAANTADDDDQQTPTNNGFVPSPPMQYPRASTPIVVNSHHASSRQLDHGTPHIQRQDHLQPLRQTLQHHQALRNALPDDSVLPHDPSHHQQPSLLPDSVLGSGLAIDPQIDGTIPIILDGHGQPLDTQHAHSPFPLSQDLSPNITQSSHSYVQHPYGSQTSPRPPVAVYLRLHPSSAMTMAPSIWIATLAARTLEELQQVAVKDFAGSVCGRVEGILGEGMTIEGQATLRGLEGLHCRPSARAATRSGTASWQSVRCYASEKQDGGPSFKGQMLESISSRIAREKQERAKFAAQRQNSAGSRAWGITFMFVAGALGSYYLGTLSPRELGSNSTVPLSQSRAPQHNLGKANLEAAWADLASIVGKENVSTLDSDLSTHSTSGWSSYHARHDERPFCVVFPGTTEQVSEVMKICHSRRIPVVGYSGGTSLEGHFTPTSGSISIDFGRMNKVLKLHKDDLDVVVQPAVGWESLNELLSQDNLFFPPDPGPGAMIGGMIGTGCSGTNAYRYGTMREWVLSLTVVLADGTIIKTRQRPRKSSAGYDLTKLFIGSEGTLGLVTEATLKVTVKPQSTSVAVCAFDTIRQAADCVGKVVGDGVPVAAVEILDEEQMKCINAAGMTSKTWKEAPTLFFKFSGTELGVKEQIQIVKNMAKLTGSRSFEFAKSEQEKAELWSARKEALWSTQAMAKEGDHVWTGDVAVPISRLPDLIELTKHDIKKSGLYATIVGHVGDGNFHVILLSNDQQRPEAEELVHTMVKRAVEMEGTVTGEHGVGLVKRDYLPHELGESTVDTMRKLKQALDPLCLLNPDKVIRTRKPRSGEIAEW